MIVLLFAKAHRVLAHITLLLRGRTTKASQPFSVWLDTPCRRVNRGAVIWPRARVYPVPDLAKCSRLSALRRAGPASHCRGLYGMRESHRALVKAAWKGLAEGKLWWQRADSNHRHKDFQYAGWDFPRNPLASFMLRNQSRLCRLCKRSSHAIPQNPPFSGHDYTGITPGFGSSDQ